MRGIDVAKWNGDIDWNLVKADGVQFAVLKVINKQNKIEDAFELNYKGASGVGIPVDVYNYLYTTTENDAVRTAYKVVEIIKGKEIDTVWADVEDGVLKNLGVGLVRIINAYKGVIEKAGYNFGVYTGLSFYNTYIKPYAAQINCPFWIARYYKNYTPMDFNEVPSESKKPIILHRLWGWQYTSSGIVDGISGSVDLDIVYNEEPRRYTLKKGSKGDCVSFLQQLLNSLGYDCGKVDGSFGTNTKAAVEQFQRVNGLAIDGVVGVCTWDKLEKNPVPNTTKTYSLKKDGNVQISANFKVKEFACNDGSDVVIIAQELVEVLQRIRTHFGKAVTINSAYRTPDYNKKVGGAASSQHLYGTAADIRIVGVAPKDVAAYAESLLFNTGGIGIYNNFVHVDVRKNKSRWNG